VSISVNVSVSGDYESKVASSLTILPRREVDDISNPNIDYT